MVAQLLSGIHHAIDRALHPWRHRRAIRRLRALGSVRRILVVCQGNICRSPFAAELLAERVRSHGIEVWSAGFLGQGRPSPREALVAAAEHGIDLHEHRSRLVAPSLLGAVDLIIVMDGGQWSTLRFDFGRRGTRLLFLGDLDPGAPRARAIADPWERPLEEFRAVYARIDRCVGVLVTLLTEARVPTRRASPAKRSVIQTSAAAAKSRNSANAGLQSSR
jgi:protein-tyrosine-phosphatase